MKATLIILSLFSLLIGCSLDDETTVTVNGRVERELTGEGIGNQKIIIYVDQVRGPSSYRYSVEIDRKEVITNSDGSFSAKVRGGGNNTSFGIYKPQDDEYESSQSPGNFYLNEYAVLKANKLVKYKVFVNNTTPFNNEDFISVNFFSKGNSYVDGIENFGADNVYHPLEDGIGPIEETAWHGTDVNSIIYFSVSENTPYFKLRWYKKKDGIKTEGFAENLPSEIDVLNEYHFDY